MAKPIELTPAEAAHLLELARESIRSSARGLIGGVGVEPSGALAEPAGVFVSLHQRSDGSLRGCVGSLLPIRSLADAVVAMAAAASNQDPRFDPVRPEDVDNLHIEISVLSPLRRIRNPEEIEVGTHGVRVTRGNRTGVLLPQVAPRYEWTAEQFLEAVCKKAGLPADAWQAGDAEIDVFAARILSED